MVMFIKKKLTTPWTMALLLLLIVAMIPSFSDASEFNFSYSPDAENGPANWSRLTDIPNNECGGMKQSPIAIESSPCTTHADFPFKDGSCITSFMEFEIKNNEVLATYPAAADEKCTPNSFSIPGIPGEYEAIQYHIHLSSEHMLDGDLHAAELHIVHKSTVDNTLAVVGMFLDPKSAENNQEFDKILRGWEKYAEETASICNSTISNLTTIEEEGTSARHRQDRRLEAFNIYSLLAEGTGFYHYDGSLTTPPCSEIVFWSLADTNTKISVYQYNQLTSLVLEFMSRETCELATIASKSGTSSRPQQPLNGRIIKHICPESAEPTATADSPESSSASSAMTKATAFAAAAATSTAGILGAAAGLF